MNSAKRYTTQTFTRRVDHDGGLHREPAGIPEPAVCRECGAIYVNRRWTTHGRMFEKAKRGHWHPAHETTCPACVQADNGTAGGYLTVDGSFFVEHKAEIGRLLSNEAEKAHENNPLSRIMLRVESDDKLLVETTTEHLVQRLGHALEKRMTARSNTTSRTRTSSFASTGTGMNDQAKCAETQQGAPAS